MPRTYEYLDHAGHAAASLRRCTAARNLLSIGGKTLNHATVVSTVSHVSPVKRTRSHDLWER